MKSRDCLLEIIHKDVSKANGIDLLAKELGIKQSEVMAIGDEENDVSMIEYAGMGVVMENGNENLKKLAQFVTKSNQEDGVAHAVEKFVLVD
jgi:Cof subfamily protein (haloacid dehalogenase superfamily)